MRFLLVALLCALSYAQTGPCQVESYKICNDPSLRNFNDTRQLSRGTWEEVKSTCIALGNQCAGLTRYQNDGGTYNDGSVWWFQTCATTEVSDSVSWEFIPENCLTEIGDVVWIQVCNTGNDGTEDTLEIQATGYTEPLYDWETSTRTMEHGLGQGELYQWVTSLVDIISVRLKLNGSDGVCIENVNVNEKVIAEKFWIDAEEDDCPKENTQRSPAYPCYAEEHAFRVASACPEYTAMCGWRACLALKTDGTVQAWGLSEYVPSSGDLTNIAYAMCGGNACVSLKNDGQARAWGDPLYGGDASTVDLTNVATIMCGVVACVALKNDGTGEAWGYPAYGGNASGVNLSNVAYTMCGRSACVALKNDGTAESWGYSGKGGNSSSVDLTNIAHVDCGGYACVALKRDGTVVAWGAFGSGGNAPNDLTNVASVMCGAFACVAVKSDGTMISWGGVHEDINPSGVNLTNIETNVAYAMCGGYACVALRNDHTGIAWGDLQSGGDASSVDLTNVSHIMCGYYACVALKKDGSGQAWGHPDYGGDASAVNLTNVASIMCGAHDCIALKNDGNAQSWGSYSNSFDVTNIKTETCETSNRGINYNVLPLDFYCDEQILLPQAVSIEQCFQIAERDNWCGSAEYITIDKSANEQCYCTPAPDDCETTMHDTFSQYITYRRILAPTSEPTREPSGFPSFEPTTEPSYMPSYMPTNAPSQNPSSSPSSNPTHTPTCDPTREPSTLPSFEPTSKPSYMPSRNPTIIPSQKPTVSPTSHPSWDPTLVSLPECVSVSGSPAVWGRYDGSYHLRVLDELSMDGEEVYWRLDRWGTIYLYWHEGNWIISHQISAIQLAVAYFPSPNRDFNETSSGFFLVPENDTWTLIQELHIEDNCAPTSDPTRELSTLPSFEPTSKPSYMPSRNPTIIPSQKPSDIPTSHPSWNPTHGIPSQKPTAYMDEMIRIEMQVEGVNVTARQVCNAVAAVLSGICRYVVFIGVSNGRRNLEEILDLYMGIAVLNASMAKATVESEHFVYYVNVLIPEGMNATGATIAEEVSPKCVSVSGSPAGWERYDGSYYLRDSTWYGERVYWRSDVWGEIYLSWDPQYQGNWIIHDWNIGAILAYFPSPKRDFPVSSSGWFRVNGTWTFIQDSRIEEICAPTELPTASPTGPTAFPTAPTAFPATLTAFPATTYDVNVEVRGLPNGNCVTVFNFGDMASACAGIITTVTTGVLEGSIYNVIIEAQPEGYACTVEKGLGTITADDVIVQILCNPIMMRNLTFEGDYDSYFPTQNEYDNFLVACTATYVAYRVWCFDVLRGSIIVTFGGLEIGVKGVVSAIEDNGLMNISGFDIFIIEKSNESSPSSSPVYYSNVSDDVTDQMLFGNEQTAIGSQGFLLVAAIGIVLLYVVALLRIYYQPGLDKVEKRNDAYVWIRSAFGTFDFCSDIAFLMTLHFSEEKTYFFIFLAVIVTSSLKSITLLIYRAPVLLKEPLVNSWKSSIRSDWTLLAILFLLTGLSPLYYDLILTSQINFPISPPNRFFIPTEKLLHVVMENLSSIFIALLFINRINADIVVVVSLFSSVVFTFILLFSGGCQVLFNDATKDGSCIDVQVLLKREEIDSIPSCRALRKKIEERLSSKCLVKVWYLIEKGNNYEMRIYIQSLDKNVALKKKDMKEIVDKELDEMEFKTRQSILVTNPADQEVQCGVLSRGSIYTTANILLGTPSQEGGADLGDLQNLENADLSTVVTSGIVPSPRYYIPASKSSVYLGKWLNSQCAFKRTKGLEKYASEGTLYEEVSRHPCICQYYGICRWNEDVFIVMQYFKDGSLLEVLKNRTFTDAEKIQFCIDLASGLWHMHQKDVLHGDLALRNVLIDISNARAVLADFGQSCKSPCTKKLKHISPPWTSPELARTWLLTKESDIWALGCTFWELFSDGRRPYMHIKTVDHVILRLQVGDLRPVCNPSWPVSSILNQVFEAKASERWGAEQLIDRLEKCKSIDTK